MKEYPKHAIDLKLDELAKELKIEMEDKDWQERLKKEVRNTKIYAKVYFFLTSVILILSVSAMLIGLIFDGEELFGIYIEEKYLHMGMVITFSLTLGLNFGPLNLRKEKIKTFLFLNQLNSQ